MLLFQNTNLQMWYRSTKTYAARTEDIITSLKCLYKTITSSFFFVKIYTISIRSRSRRFRIKHQQTTQFSLY